MYVNTQGVDERMINVHCYYDNDAAAAAADDDDDDDDVDIILALTV